MWLAYMERMLTRCPHLLLPQRCIVQLHVAIIAVLAAVVCTHGIKDCAAGRAATQLLCRRWQ